MLGFQSVVLGLTTPVMITVEDVPKAWALVLGLGLAVAALVIAGLLRYEWAYALGFVIQVASFGLALIIPLMVVLAVVFAALWTTAYVLGRKIEREQAERAVG